MNVVLYEPRGAALALWKCKAPDVLIEGPAGTGKTRGILHKVLALADKYPKSRHLLCRKTRASMTESVLVTLETKCLPPGHPIAKGPQRMHRQHYDLPNGSTLVIGGLDTPERTFSTEYDTVSIFEATEVLQAEDDKLQRSLRNGRMPYHQLLRDCNPGPTTHWLNQRGNAGRLVRLLSRHEDNPELWDATRQEWTPRGREYIGRLDRLTGVLHKRLRLGIWATAEGAVYESVWDPAVHLVDRFEIPREWPRYWAIDFGFSNPFVWKSYAEDPDGRLIRYREIYKTQRLVEDHARQVLDICGWDLTDNGLVAKRDGADPLPQAIICDHDAEGRATFERHTGLRTTPAYKAVLEGIEAVSVRLRKAGDGRPRLLYMRDSLVERDEALAAARRPTCSEEEFESYVWPKSQDGKPAKEAPVKENDHGMDADRYMVAERDGIAETEDVHDLWVSEDFRQRISPV